MKKVKRLAIVLMAAALLAAFAACGGSPEPADISSAPEPVTEPTAPTEKEYVFINTLPELVMGSRFPSHTKEANAKHEINGDTVGWLSVPGTAIDEEVLYNNDGNNKYYERRDFFEKYSQPGVLYSDFRGRFGDGGLEGLLGNTVIYGHNLGEEYDEDLKFGPLLKFADEDFARETPYVSFSTLREDLVWEVFAVFYVTVELPYNVPDLPAEQFVEIVDEARQRSLYNYNMKVGADDKILTLSTCCYSVPGIGPVGYPSDYRFVVMAKLVDTREATKEEADFEPNETPKAA